MISNRSSRKDESNQDASDHKILPDKKDTKKTIPEYSPEKSLKQA
jgi:hypothetical protein